MARTILEFVLGTRSLTRRLSKYLIDYWGMNNSRSMNTDYSFCDLSITSRSFPDQCTRHEPLKLDMACCNSRVYTRPFLAILVSLESMTTYKSTTNLRLKISYHGGNRPIWHATLPGPRLEHGHVKTFKASRYHCYCIQVSP